VLNFDAELLQINEIIYVEGCCEQGIDLRIRLFEFGVLTLYLGHHRSDMSFPCLLLASLAVSYLAARKLLRGSRLRLACLLRSSNSSVTLSLGLSLLTLVLLGHHPRSPL
jgi:hypothetical protein